MSGLLDLKAPLTGLLMLENNNIGSKNTSSEQDNKMIKKGLEESPLFFG
jgi:hypothetical protein